MDKIFTPIKQRILQFIDNEKISKESFYKKTGISASNFKGSGLKSEIGGEKIAKILTEYDKINSEWLLIGKGEMIKKIIIIDDDFHLLKEPEQNLYSENTSIYKDQLLELLKQQNDDLRSDKELLKKIIQMKL